jgi:hypothetical protein
MLFGHTYNHLGELMPDFVELCEAEIPPLPIVDASQKGSFAQRDKARSQFVVRLVET